VTHPDDLGARIVRATAGRLEQLVAPLPSGHPEIGDLDVFMGGQHDVLGLEVSVTDAKVVAIVETPDDLLKVFGRLVGIETAGRH
jgi:hypothetical protein